MSSDAVYVPVLPSFRDFKGQMDAGVKGAGKSAGDTIARELEQSVSRAERAIKPAAKAAETAHRNVATAAERVTQREIDLAKARESGNPERVARAEDNVADARRKLETATNNAARADENHSRKTAELAVAREGATSKLDGYSKALDRQAKAEGKAEAAADKVATATDTVQRAQDGLNTAREAGDPTKVAQAELDLEKAVRLQSEATTDSAKAALEAEDAQDRAAQAGRDFERSQDDLAVKAAQAGGSISDLADDASKAEDDLDSLASTGEGLGDRIMGGLRVMATGALLGIGADIGRSLMSGIQSAFQGGWELALDLDQAQLVLGGLYGDAELAAETIAGIGDMARVSPIDMSTYIGAAESLALAGVEGERAIEIMENVGLSAIGGGRDTEQAFSSVSNALGRMVGEGRVTAQSLQQIGDAGVFISTALADHLGVSVEEMRKMITEGAVEMEDVLVALAEMPGEAAQASLRAGIEASSSFSNQMSMIRGQIDQDIASAISPALQQMAEDGTFEEIAQGVADLVTSLIDLLPMLIDIGLWIIDNREWILPLAGIIGGITAAVWLLNLAMAANPVGALIIAFTAVVGALIYFFTQTEHGQKVIDELWSFLKRVGSWIGDVFTSIWDGVTSAWDAAWDWISNLIDSIKDGWESFKDSAIEVWNTVTDKIDEAVEFIKGIPGTIKDFFSDAGSWLVDAGKNIIEGLVDGLKSVGGLIIDTILDLIPDGLVGTVKSVLGIESPSTVFAEIGENVGEGMIVGLESMGGGVADAAQSMADSAAAVDTPAVGVAPAAAPVAASVDVGTFDGSAFAGAADSLAATAGGVLDPMWDGQGDQVEHFGQRLTDTAEGVVAPSWDSMAAGLASTTSGMLDPVWAQQSAQVEGFGQTMATTAQGVVTPSWDTMAGNLASTASGVIHPMMAGVQQGLGETGSVFQAQTGGVMTPAWADMGSAVDAVKTGTIDPAFAGVQMGLAETGQAFATGTAGMIAEWDKLREGTAAPARFTINTVFAGVGNMWNEVAEMVGLDRMNISTANFWAGGVLPGYTPGRDPFTFVEPNTGMSIGLSGGESIMRPEWTRAVGPDTVDALNAAARRGGVDEVRQLMAPHGGRNLAFATGGVMPGLHLGDFSQGAVIDSMTSFVNRFFPELQLTSGWRFTDSGYHSRGLAGDYSNQVSGGPPTPASIGLARAIYRNFAGQTAQLIHAPLQGWQNLLNGAPWDYGPTTDRQHWDHVHWALERPLMAAGTDLDLSGGVGVVVDPREIVESMIGDVMGDTQSAVDGYQGRGGSIDGMPGAMWDKLRDATLDTLVEAFEEFGGDPGGTDVARWRPLAMQALARHGYDAAQHIDAMLQQIGIESGGDPTALNLWDSNAAAGHPSGGLLQVIEPTYRRVRNAYPEAFVGLPDDHFHPLTNLTAGVGAVKMDWGGPAGRWPTVDGYDQGGWLPPTPGGFGTYYNHTGDVEAVLTNPQWRGIYNLVTVTAELLDPLRRLARDGRDMARHIEEVADNTRRQVQAGLDAAGLAVWEALPGEMQDAITAANAAGRMWDEISHRLADKALAWSKGEWPIGSARTPTVEPGPGWEEFRLDDSLQDVARANLDLAEAVITGELSAGSDPVANALYDIFGRDPILPDLARIATGGENAIVAATEAAWHAFETGETARLEEWTDSNSQLTEAVLRARDAAIHTGQMVEGAVNGYLNWAMASESQGRMGSWQEYFQHYGGMYGTAEGDWLLSQVGLGGILGGKFKDSFANLLIETAQSPLLAAPAILDDDGRVIGTQLEPEEPGQTAPTSGTETLTADLSTMADVREAESDEEAQPAGDKSIQVEVTLPEGKSAFTAEEVEGMLSQIDEDVDEIKIKVNRLENDPASVTSGVSLMA